MVSQRPAREIIESLRLTLQRLEQSADPAGELQETAEVKRLLLARIADLEVVSTLEAQSSFSGPAGKSTVTHVAELPPLEVAAKEEDTPEIIDSLPLEPPPTSAD